MPVAPVSEDMSPPPPPYAFVDPHISTVHGTSPRERAHANELEMRQHRRFGVSRSFSPNLSSETPSYLQHPRLQNSHPDDDITSTEHTLIEHEIHFDADVTPTALPFPQPANIYLQRGVTGRDWAHFIRCTFSAGDSSAASSRSEEATEKYEHFAGVDSAHRRAHIICVIAEWNQGFFKARNICLTPYFEAPQRSIPAHTSIEPEPILYEGKNSSHTPSADQSSHDKPPSATSSLKSLRDRKYSHSSTSSSSISSVSSISSSDLNHATVPEIRSLLTAFCADAFKKNHLRKSVHEFRHQLRTQHMPMSSSDPKAHLPNTKDAKKRFQQARKDLRKEIKATIEEIRTDLMNEQRARRGFRRHHRESEIAGAHRNSECTSSIASLVAASGVDERCKFDTAGRNAQSPRMQSSGQESARRSKEEAKEAVWRAQHTAANAAGEIPGTLALDHALAASKRAHAVATDATGRHYRAGASSRDAIASERAQNTARQYRDSDWPKYGRAQGKEAQYRASDAARRLTESLPRDFS